MVKNFIWRDGSPLPKIEDHSDRKLQVIEDYLEAYFDTVAKNPRQELLKITLVDAFCGGGLYDSGRRGEPRLGSPFVLLEGVRRAEKRLNAKRVKPLKIDADFLFSDEKQQHLEHLHAAIRSSDFSDRLGQSIHLTRGKFSDLLPKYVEHIKARQTAGRSIFILDQFGYSDVPMKSIQLLFRSLRRVEALLTFSIDGLLNYLGDDSRIENTVAQFGVDGSFLANWKEWKQDPKLGRATAQRTIMESIRIGSGAKFFTPFMLRSPAENRWMMLAHLSQNQAARDKMLDVHWDLQNSFKHMGRGSLFQLGFDQRCIESSASLFNFAEDDRARMISELECELPEKVFDLIRQGELPVQSLLEIIGNQTAATNRDLFSVLGMLSAEREIEIRKSKGGKKRPGTAVAATDTLLLPDQPTFYFPKPRKVQ